MELYWAIRIWICGSRAKKQKTEKKSVPITQVAINSTASPEVTGSPQGHRARMWTQMLHLSTRDQARWETDDVIKQEHKGSPASERSEVTTLHPDLFNLSWFLSGRRLWDFDRRVWSSQAAIRSEHKHTSATSWSLELNYTSTGELNNVWFLTPRADPNPTISL